MLMGAVGSGRGVFRMASVQGVSGAAATRTITLHGMAAPMTAIKLWLIANELILIWGLRP